MALGRHLVVHVGTNGGEVRDDAETGALKDGRYPLKTGMQISATTSPNECFIKTILNLAQVDVKRGLVSRRRAVHNLSIVSVYPALNDGKPSVSGQKQSAGRTDYTSRRQCFRLLDSQGNEVYYANKKLMIDC